MNVLPFELQAHIFSFASLLDRAFIIPQVCQSWKLYMDGLKNPPLDVLTRKVMLQWEENHLAILKHPFNAYSYIVWRREQNRIFVDEASRWGDVLVKSFFKIVYTPIEVKGRMHWQNVKLLIVTEPLCWYGKRWTDWLKWIPLPQSRYTEELQLIKPIVSKAFKLCIDRIAEKNFRFIDQIEKKKRYRLKCDDQGEIRELGSTHLGRKKGWKYFLIEPIKIDARDLLIWKEETKFAEDLSIPVGCVFRWAVISKTTKLFAEALGYSYRI